MRCWGQLAWAAAACAALAGCGTLANPSPRATATLPPACPQRVVTRLGPEGWTAARVQLAPAGANAIRLCRYAGLNASPRLALTGSRLVRGSRLVSGLAGELDALQPLPRGVLNCPEDDGSQIVALLAYPGRHVVTIGVGLTGCRVVANGSVTRTALSFRSPPAAFSLQLVPQLERLVPNGSNRSSSVGAGQGHAVKILRPATDHGVIAADSVG